MLSKRFQSIEVDCIIWSSINDIHVVAEVGYSILKYDVHSDIE